MKYVKLGNTGLRVSPLSLGCMTYGSPQWRDWVLDEAASLPFIGRALEMGINFFDTADVYSLGESEVVLGRALKHFGAKREHVVIATKVWNVMSSDCNDRGLSRKHIMQDVDASLRRLGTDYIDLYQIHRYDPHTPIEETLEALNDLVRMGKVLYLGASSMYAWQFAKAQHVAEQHGWTKFVTMQNHYNLVYREEEREMLPLCSDQGVGVIPWSPLARGLLTSDAVQSTTRSETDEYAKTLYGTANMEIVQAVADIAAERGVSRAAVGLAWVAKHPTVTAPIIGATKPQHIADALTSLDITLTADEIARLESPYTPQPVQGH